MNILFFLTPKSEVDMVYEDDTVGQALNRLESHQFTSIPIINEQTGKYLGTLSEGDLLRFIAQNNDTALRIEEDRPVMSIHRKRDYKAVRASADIQDLFDMTVSQNFVPVLDDTDAFIGIVTRTQVLNYMIRALGNEKEAQKKIS